MTVQNNRFQLTGSNVIVPVEIQGIYRITADITSTTLAANGIYTGASFDSAPTNGAQYARIKGAYVTDVSGTLVLQFSDNGTTWVDATTIAAGLSGKFDEPFYARYSRLKFTNGASVQTSFRLFATAWSM